MLTHMLIPRKSRMHTTPSSRPEHYPATLHAFQLTPCLFWYPAHSDIVGHETRGDCNQATGCVSPILPPPSSTSTGCLSRHSNHWITLPIRKHQLPQNVASEPWYTHPLFAAPKPRAPQSVKPIPCFLSAQCFPFAWCSRQVCHRGK